MEGVVGGSIFVFLVRGYVDERTRVAAPHGDHDVWMPIESLCSSLSVSLNWR